MIYRNWRDCYDRVPDMSVDDLGDYIIGRRVVKVDECANEITLDDGKVLLFRDADGCHAWFSAELEAGNLTDNAVTALGVTERETDSESTEDYTIHILAADKNVADVTITGDATSGYYCRSIILEIYTAEDTNA